MIEMVARYERLGYTAAQVVVVVVGIAMQAALVGYSLTLRWYEGLAIWGFFSLVEAMIAIFAVVVLEASKRGDV